jgi:predicted kinase
MVTLLVVFAGLPGSGKSVLARGVADEIGATYLRIDTIESAIVSTLMPYRDNPVGTSLPSGLPPTSWWLAGTWWPMP